MGQPEEVPLLPPGVGASAVALDRAGNVYVCTPEGVLIGDEGGEPIACVPTPEPATGLCFGGPSLSELYVTTASGAWRLKTATQGVAPPSDQFMKMMDKFVAAGDFRHVGW